MGLLKKLKTDGSEIFAVFAQSWRLCEKSTFRQLDFNQEQVLAKTPGLRKDRKDQSRDFHFTASPFSQFQQTGGRVQ
jgi:hypothetical protein